MLLGLQDREPAEQTMEIADTIASIVPLRATQVSVDDLQRDGSGFAIEPLNVCSRFALQFAQRSDGHGMLVRAETVWGPFIAPFRLFVSPSVSIHWTGRPRLPRLAPGGRALELALQPCQPRAMRGHHHVVSRVLRTGTQQNSQDWSDTR